MGIAFLWYLYGEGISLRVWEYFSGILSRAIARNKPSLAVVNHLLLPNTKTFLIFIIFTKHWKIPVSKYKDDYVCYSHLLHFGVWGIIKRFRNSSAWKPQLMPSSATSIKSFISCADYSSILHQNLNFKIDTHENGNDVCHFHKKFHLLLRLFTLLSFHLT